MAVPVTVDTAFAQQLQTNSVQIIMYLPGDLGKSFPAHGLGTVTMVNGEMAIINHNHWGDALYKMAFAQLLSSDNQLLLDLEPFAFRGLIRDLDASSMVLALHRISGLRGARYGGCDACHGLHGREPH